MPLDPFRGPPVLSEPVRQLIGQLPFFIGPAYNALRAGNQITKWIQGLTGNLPANQALPGNDPDYNNPNYIGLGDPIGTPDTSANAPSVAPSATTPATPAPTAPQSSLYANYFGGSTAPSVSWNAGRPAFGPTYQQLTNPGSAIGPTSGSTSIDPRLTAGLGTPNAVISGIPGWAANNTSEIYRKNLI